LETRQSHTRFQRRTRFRACCHSPPCSRCNREPEPQSERVVVDSAAEQAGWEAVRGEGWAAADPVVAAVAEKVAVMATVAGSEAVQAARDWAAVVLLLHNCWQPCLIERTRETCCQLSTPACRPETGIRTNNNRSWCRNTAAR